MKSSIIYEVNVELKKQLPLAGGHLALVDRHFDTHDKVQPSPLVDACRKENTKTAKLRATDFRSANVGRKG
jgi:hypothetical protein